MFDFTVYHFDCTVCCVLSFLVGWRTASTIVYLLFNEYLYFIGNKLLGKHTVTAFALLGRFF